MEAERESLCVVPRGLVVGEVNETFVCGICDGLLREPRYAGACSEHLLCRVCLAAALIKEACCPTCKQPVDASEPLNRFGPFEAMVNSTVVQCPNSTAGRGGASGNISQEPAASREATSSSAPIRSSVTRQELIVLCKRREFTNFHDRYKDELLKMLTPLFKTPDDVACALQEASGAERPRSYGGTWGGFTGDYEDLDLEELQKEALCEGVALTGKDRFYLPSGAVEGSLSPLVSSNPSP
ncbi:hypothetical protein T484DRAFT_1823155 [Baffinella frigidus]|nr:hypothetical protein T484DRAFT_1823155 [Cryptophyta sp. CCMP2293]